MNFTKNLMFFFKAPSPDNHITWRQDIAQEHSLTHSLIQGLLFDGLWIHEWKT